MAMAAPPRCIPLSVRKRELTEDTFHSARVAGADALAPSGEASARPLLGFLYRVSFSGSHEPHFLTHLGLQRVTRATLLDPLESEAHKDAPPSTQFGYRHEPHFLTHWGLQRVTRATLLDPLGSEAHKGAPPSTQLGHRPNERPGADLRTAGHPSTDSGTFPTNCREQTQELHLSQVSLGAAYFETWTPMKCWSSR